ncbi:DUF4177 domain-containing protein [Mangrovimonas xylaniphaga]|uniref:DUF4177 domain-containing protein n=1 Tax=Mangrovimonas xylaniphaga TaxID=1645915 RepID=UPI000ADB0802|nr:DUF4177 domain-containing protein [Mangrovimonas xylaniphaga]
MKEYKVSSRSIGLRNPSQKLEDHLNQHAREGWKVIHINASMTTIVFEREKFR